MWASIIPRDKRATLETHRQVVAVARRTFFGRDVFDPVAVEDDDAVVDCLAGTDDDVGLDDRDPHSSS
jgi:hypothetical protein